MSKTAKLPRVVNDVDLVIVGGGPSGISTALHLHAVAPHLRVVVLEAETYPREKICAGGIGARAFRKLEALGVTVSCPMVNLNAIALRFPEDTIVIRDPDLGVVVRRVEFDHAFAKAAIARGIEVRDGTRVSSIVVDEAYVRVETDRGETFHARAIVGADGVSGITRRMTGFPRAELRAQVVELDTEGLPDDQPRDTVVFDFKQRDLNGYAWDFPTVVDNRPLVCRGAYVIHNLGSDSPKHRIEQYLTARGLDMAHYKLKQYAERGFLPGAEIAKPRVLLVGEAAGIDIATGEGIAQAVEYGYVAGPYLAKAFQRDDFGFADYGPHLEQRHLGWQMRARHLAYEGFYGPNRDTISRLLPKMPSVVRIGIEDFAGKPFGKLNMLRAAGQFLAHYSRHKMRTSAET